MSDPVGVLAFEQLADEYDTTFTDTTLGRLLRGLVWQQLDPLVTPGMRVLELNCGTGEDAVHLATLGAHVLATDVSPAMVAATRAKAHAAGLGDRVEAQELAIESLADLSGDAFDLVLSDFGGVNCVADLALLGRGLAACTARGAEVVLVVMGPTVPWEWAWFLAHGRPCEAVRRLRTATEWRGITIRYPSPRTLARALSPTGFGVVASVPIGVALPPPYTDTWVTEHPRLLRALERWEHRLARAPGTAYLGDHYLLRLRRT